MNKTPIEIACQLLGGQSRLAAALGVKPPTVAQWVTRSEKNKRKVPAERCPEIERATNGAVRCEDLRPDVEWSVLRRPCHEDNQEAA